jgi:ketosteroid isomerase-like protein
MSEVERIIRETRDAWNSNDWSRFDELWAEDAEIVPPPIWPESGTFQGRKAVRAEFERLKESWAVDRLELLSLESRAGHGLACVRWVGSGQASGFPLDLTVWFVAEVRDGRNQRVEYYIDEEDARTAFEGAAARQ